ncbi:MAG: hypothetical protein U0931_38945 [Vulcanimicrobiota bacterium]
MTHIQLLEFTSSLLESNPREALPKLRGHLRALNQGRAGYHETLTCCWLELVRLARGSGLGGSELLRRLSFSQLPLAFYSPRRLASQEAMGTFLCPDRAPIELPPELPDELLQPLLAFQSRRLAPVELTPEVSLRLVTAAYRVLGSASLHFLEVGAGRLGQAHGLTAEAARELVEALFNHAGLVVPGLGRNWLGVEQV